MAYASHALRADREIVIAAVSHDGLALQFASAGLRADRELVLLAVAQTVTALDYASEVLKADREFMLAVLPLKVLGWGLPDASVTLQADPKLRAMAAVLKSPMALQAVPMALRADRDIVCMALLELERASSTPDHDHPATHAEVLRHASPTLKAD
eukprot:COSAG05_NODE_333_length_11249_cov_629.633094_12_plen_155_part_00